MTKSIKEKERLQKIKNHELNETDVPAHLLKIKISYVYNPYVKHYSRVHKSHYLNPEFIKEHTGSFFKKHIQEILLKIANNLKIYELKVQVSIGTTKAKNEKLDFLYLRLKLNDHKNKIIGSIVLTSDNFQESVFSEKYYYDHTFVTSKSIGCFWNYEKSDYINKIMHIKNMMEFIYNNRNKISILLNNEYNHKNPRITKTFNEFTKNNTVYNLTKMLKKLRITKILMSVSDSIECVLVTNCFAHYTHSKKMKIEDYDEFNHIEYIKNIGFIKIPIDDEDMKAENINEIRLSIKALTY